ncbi:hypothetical protein [Rheinheimera sp.]|uniref:hypothetical protein n=1 Tax=Rheinheimera sp. TaxID=1869214 RepID=UPI002FDD46CD
MSEIEPQPWLVIRNQLLAFALLTVLGSCVPLPKQQAADPLQAAASPEYSNTTDKNLAATRLKSSRWYSAR